MTAKEYLSQIRLLDVKIRQKEEERDALKALAEGNGSPGLNPNKVQTSIRGDPMGDRLAAAADIDREIDQDILDLVIMRHRIIKQIQTLTDVRFVELLQLKYVGERDRATGRVHYLRLEEIACVMKKSNGLPYSYEHIRSLHGLALKSFSEIM